MIFLAVVVLRYQAVLRAQLLAGRGSSKKTRLLKAAFFFGPLPGERVVSETCQPRAYKWSTPAINIRVFPAHSLIVLPYLGCARGLGSLSSLTSMSIAANTAVAGQGAAETAHKSEDKPDGRRLARPRTRRSRLSPGGGVTDPSVFKDTLTGARARLPLRVVVPNRDGA